MSRKTKQNKKKSPRLRRHSVFTLLSNGRFCITDANRPRNSVWLTISSTSLARHELRKRGSKKRQATFRSCAHHNATSPKGTMFVISNSPERGEQPPPLPPAATPPKEKKKCMGVTWKCCSHRSTATLSAPHLGVCISHRSFAPLCIFHTAGWKLSGSTGPPAG